MRKVASGVLLTTGLMVLIGGGAPEREDVEVARIQAHLAEVLSSLRDDPPTGLTPEQRAARATTLEWLDEYRAAGDFPHNHVHPEGRVPVFVDPHGTPCAVGYLMVRSGAHELVEEIVRTNNLVRVPELAGDERLAAWLDEHGLTLTEAARIQPMYDGFPETSVVRAEYEKPLTVGLSIATAALVSYATMIEPQQGRPWLDALTIATSVGHMALLVNAGTNDIEDEAWVVGLNVVGAFVAAGSVVTRALGRDEDEARSQQSALGAFVSPGPYGTRFGLTVRH